MSNDVSTRRFKLLANETRWQVLKLLYHQSLNVSEIASSLNIEQSLLSHHLSLLRAESLVIAKRKGKEIYYSVDPHIRGENSQFFHLGCCDIKFC